MKAEYLCQMKKETVNVKQEFWPKESQSDFIIAGPCSAESEKQVVETALELAKNPKVAGIRAGVWKPRTRPGMFEGKGQEALAWMKSASKASGLPVCTEVANTKHVEQALEAGIDALWLGARTTVNPFYVQEIAESLKGVDIPVWVKNPMHPDIKLWIGAIERFQAIGTEKIGGIHRGFYSYDSRPFRNEPKWELAVEFRRLLPNTALICDPSHIAGNRSLIAEVCQTAIDLDMNGLMVEVHPDPDNALSDAEQQINPAALTNILEQLVWRKAEVTDQEFLLKLEELRKLIDTIDENLVNTLSERMKLVEEIGRFKAENNVTIFQLKRWFKILQERKSQANSLNLSEELIHELYQLIHKNSIRIQSGVMKKIR